MNALAYWVVSTAVTWACGYLYGIALGNGRLKDARRVAGSTAAAYTLIVVINTFTRDWYRTGDAAVIAAFWVWMWCRIRAEK